MEDAKTPARNSLDRLGPLAADLKAADPERFLAGLFAPEPGRRHLFALLAFNAELARIGEVVSEPMIGEIRLRWWHEQLPAIAEGSPPAHPVAEALSAALTATGLGAEALEPLIDARVADCYPEPYPTTEEFGTYIDTTGAALHEIAAEILVRTHGGALGAEEREGVRAAGRAWARLGVLRALPFHTVRGRVSLPCDLLSQAGLTAGAGLEGCARSRLAPLLEGILQEAEDDYRAARQVFAALPKPARPALFHLALFRPLARAIRKRNFELDRPVEPQNPLARQMRVLGAALRGRI